VTVVLTVRVRRAGSVVAISRPESRV